MLGAGVERGDLPGGAKIGQDISRVSKFARISEGRCAGRYFFFFFFF